MDGPSPGRSRWLPWIFGIRGVVAILFGIVAVVVPDLTFSVLVIVFGAFALVDGVFSVGGGIRRRRWPLVLEGIVGIVVGVVVLAFPALANVAVVYAIAIWAILTGAIELVDLARRREQRHAWWVGVGGVASILFGVALALEPGVGIRILVLVIGVFAIVFGVTLLGAGLKLRNEQRAGRLVAEAE